MGFTAALGTGLAAYALSCNPTKLCLVNTLQGKVRLGQKRFDDSEIFRVS
jgi:hypothetical protein